MDTPGNKDEALLSKEQVEQAVKEHITRMVEELSVKEKIEQEVKAQLQKSQKDEQPAKGTHINNYIEFANFYSGAASSVNRSLALAGVAIIWIFKKPPEGSTEIVRDILNFPLFCLVISLGLDLLQYFLGTVFWRIFFEVKFSKWKNKQITNEQAKDVEAPNALSIILDVIFVLKITTMIVAYVYLFKFLLQRI